jgi:hypothetical protein
MLRPFFCAVSCLAVVMAGLGPAIHDFPMATSQIVDARLKAGHDGI